MDLLFRNATIVSDGVEMTGDLAVKGGIVRAIGHLAGVSADEVVDCRGKILLPGAVDIGVSLCSNGEEDPASQADFSLMTREAARGGVTTIVAAAAPNDGESLKDAAARHREALQPGALTDFGIHLGVNAWNERMAGEIPGLLEAGVSSVWLARTELGSSLPAPGLIAAVLEDLPEGMLAIVPPFDAALDAFYRQRAYSKPEGGWSSVYPSFVEAGFFCMLTGIAANCRAHVVVHGISSAEAARNLARARERCPRLVAACHLSHLHYVDRQEEFVPLSWPPVREQRDQDALYAALEGGLIGAVVSDHRPRTAEETWPHGEVHPLLGVSTLGHYYALLYNEGVKKGRLSVGALSQAAAADPAKLAGLYPRKGTLQPGADADIVVLNPNEVRAAASSSLQAMVGDFLDPLAQAEFTGRLEAVYLRGKKIADADGVEEGAAGQFLRRRGALD